MSLSQLLGLASSEASGAVTPAAGLGGPGGERDGEIVFSKNNVCVHPAESLSGQTAHCPGYLCVRMEEDEELGTTLILTWVPNSRIQGRDEAALRYVTPESSPMPGSRRRLSPRCSGPGAPPAPEGPEVGGGEGPALGRGGAELGQREEEGRECSSVPVDPGLDSPSCLPPVSKAPPACSESGHRGNGSRETREEPVTQSACSTSSLSPASPAPSEDGQSQPAGWEEQQNVPAWEPLCGVFRVDLGHVRSMRLFFSDEACASGQLVIAGRENHFKILHFHHAGLDKLTEVFQQWKCCQETQLRDQVLDGRSCLQFSVLRPSPPSSAPHPEERLHRALDAAAWRRLLSGSGGAEEQLELRKAVFFGGVHPAIRGEVWPFLLRYHSWGSNAAEREARRQEKHRQYQEIQQRRLSMSPEEKGEFWRKVQFTVDRDVVRTDCSSPFFRGEDNPNVERMRRILLNYAVLRSDVGYCQGMSDLLAPLLMEVQDEADAFWCFMGLMERSSFVSSPQEDGMEEQLALLREMLRLTLPQFHGHLARLGEDGLRLLFCHRWVLLRFRREFPQPELLRMWEACWASYQTDYFHLFLCVAIIMLYGESVAEQQMAVDQMLLHFSGLSMRMNGELVLRKARGLLYQFSHLPTIPCGLRSLCKLTGPGGAWECVPEVECSGESQNCPCRSSATPLTPASPQPALCSPNKGDSRTQDLP